MLSSISSGMRPSLRTLCRHWLDMKEDDGTIVGREQQGLVILQPPTSSEGYSSFSARRLNSSGTLRTFCIADA